MNTTHTPRTSHIILPLFLSMSLAASGFQMISVNFNGFSGGDPGPTQVGSSLVGPGGGLGTSWNQYAAKSSSGVMVDSTGAATTATVVTNFSEGRYDGTAPTLTMLRATLTDFNKGVAGRTVTISGLAANAKYDVWLVSHRHQGTAERQAGIWSTANTTTSPPSQIVDGRAALNGATFVAGVNYALFQNVVANGSGVITFTGAGGTTANGFDTTYRMHLNGLQIIPSPVRQPLEVTGFAFNPAGDQVTLTWKSNPGEFYGLTWSEDLQKFYPGINPAVPAHATATRTTYGPFANPSPGAKRLFFRVGPPDLVDPVMQQVWGAGSTITLNFSEAMSPAAATNLANFTVMKNGSTPVTVSAVTLSPDGKTITLTLASPLDIGTAYSVTTSHLTDLAGRPLGNGTVGNFQTYDNNPNGVKVFILAGQSNMVGHGKAEQGVGDVAGAIGSLRYMAVTDTANYGQLLVNPATPATSAWKTRPDVKVWWRDSDITAARAVIKGDLKLGYAEGRSPTWFGPEYAFGWVMGDHYTEPVLLIKTSWGGKSLNVDFRPPSAVAARGGVVGPYYTGMIAYVRDCLANLGTEFPEFAGMGYQIAGFGWHQGYNDRIDATNSANYEVNLVDLIKDLRAEFGRPALPISIGTTGMDITGAYSLVEAAQLAVANPAKHPEFTGTVFTVDTRPFWRDSTVSPSNFGYHWNHNGESHFLIGDAMGRGVISLLTP